jgi:hypothetical protein
MHPCFATTHPRSTSTAPLPHAAAPGAMVWHKFGSMPIPHPGPIWPKTVAVDTAAPYGRRSVNNSVTANGASSTASK